MLTSKQRAALRAMANDMRPVFQIGAGGVTDNVIISVDDALAARELIKINLLKSAPIEAADALEELCAAVAAEPVACVGRRIVLYRRSQDKPVIEI